MRFNEIVNRLTGISTPIFGVNWNPPKLQVGVARKVVTFLEDKRVLYNPSELENPHHCVSSVLDVRKFLSFELSGLDSQSDLSESLRAMRAACRKFLNTVQGGDRDILGGAGRYAWDDWIFYAALGELRGVFGLHIAKIAAQYGLDIEEELASILPMPGELDDLEGK